MDNKYIAALCVIALSVSFCLASMLVVVTRRHPYFVRKKLQVGALLLSITVMVSCNRFPIAPVVTCYDPALPDLIQLQTTEGDGGQIILRSGGPATISGEIYDRVADSYSFSLVDSAGTVVETGPVIPDDGIFDEPFEQIKLTLDARGLSGIYELRLYTLPVEEISEAANYRTSVLLRVTEE